MSIQQTWEEYKRHRDGDHFTDSATVLFVPTASGARGYDAVRQYLSRAYDSHKLSVKEKVLYQTIGTDSIVEETETTIKFLTGEADWIIPGVDLRHTIDSTIVLPVVTIVTFDNDRISSLRLYWDQASALKQLKLITNKSSWPVTAERQIDAVRDITSAYLNPYSKPLLSAGLTAHNGEAGRRAAHTSSRVNQPGGTGGKSSVFGDSSDEPASRKFNQGKNTSQFSFGDSNDDYQAPPSQRRMNYNAGRSQIEIRDDDGGSTPASISGSNKKHFGKSEHHSSVQFGGTPQTLNPPQQQEQPPAPRVKPSSRILRPPGGGGSQITFG
ncbi:hypothetical protein G9A89_023336 [Geosiphon pyriformis]|nr:hypothetical protein G9A89_023336 [Geosiphon pyriformis]